MSEGFLDIFGGTREEVTGDEKTTTVDLMYRPGEPIFGAMAKKLMENGWSVFPQDEARRPGRVNYETISWSRTHNLPRELPKPRHLETWIQQCPTLNVAVALGSGSGHLFAVDIDITDPILSARVTDLAIDMLGETPFRRVGRAPKIALFYRYNPEDPVRNIARHFADTSEDGDVIASEHAIEILTEGKPITLFGKHHKTGRYFQWLEKSPLELTPEAAPVVSTERLAAFFEAIDENIQRFHRNTSTLAHAEEIEWDEEGGVNIPRIFTVAGGSPWVEDGDGLIVDGREAYWITRITGRRPGSPG